MQSYASLPTTEERQKLFTQPEQTGEGQEAKWDRK